MPDITTIAACSTGMAVIMCIVMLLTWIKSGCSMQRGWQFGPFGFAPVAGVLMSYPDILPGPWGLRLGWFALTLVYGSVWLAARATAGRKPSVIPMLLPCVAVLLLSCTIGADEHWPALRMLARNILFALFDGLAAREFARMRDPQLPSASTLFWICACFFVYDLARLPFSFFLPAPFGPGDPQVWTIVPFNFLLVMEGVLLGLFLTALAREQLGAWHYRLAAIDPLTGIGNRRAFDSRIETIAREADPEGCTAIAILDIDHFKSINDAQGHAFGDIVIIGAATVAREIVGAGNVFRIGGEEFVAIIEADTLEAVVDRAEALRTAFEVRSHVSGAVSRRCTISIGVAELKAGDDPAAVLAAADRQLYLAKSMGRNRTKIADGAVDEWRRRA